MFKIGENADFGFAGLGKRCCNQTDNAHGGFLAWLVDICSSMPMVLLGGQESWRVGLLISEMWHVY